MFNRNKIMKVHRLYNETLIDGRMVSSILETYNREYYLGRGKRYIRDNEEQRIPANVVTDLDFRRSFQLYYDGWSNEVRICRRVGRCVQCHKNIYSFDDGQNDPRGVLGNNAASCESAPDYDMVGPEIPVCFLCTNNDEYTYHRVMQKCYRQWTTPEGIRVKYDIPELNYRYTY